MSWQDRDYYDTPWQEPQRLAGGIPKPPPFTLGLLIFHAAFYLLLSATGAPGGASAAKSLALSAENHGVLPALLHPLAIPDLLALLFVLITVWSVGVLLELRLGAWRFLAHYTLANLLAGLVFVAVATANPALASGPLDYPAGALAGGCAVICSRLWFERTGFLIYVVPLRGLIAVSAGIVVLFYLMRWGAGGGAWLAAVAAAGLGGWALDALNWRRLLPRRRSTARQLAARPARSPARTVSTPSAAPIDDELDQLLSKISRDGLASLSEAERARLEQARLRKLQEDRGGHPRS